jgi:2-polyprenyl-3-methyl-5-hydroxy-6-metoxy-1,4-benzoquinol methylase
MKIYKSIQKCRISKTNLKELWNLGDIKLSHFSKKKNELLNSAPLRIGIGKNGGLLQLMETTDRDKLYRKYWYASGTNLTMTEQLIDITKKATIWAKLNKNDIVLDIGCNDGTLLESYRERHIVKIGIDPAKNFSKIAKKKMDIHLCDYFTKEKFLRISKNKKAKIITSIAMYYDLDNPLSFAKDIRNCLTDDGIWVLQMSYTPFMLMQNAFDNIIHEHLEYYSLKSLDYIIKKAKMKIVDVDFNDTNGGSVRLIVAKTEDSVYKSALYNYYIGKVRYRCVLDYENKYFKDIEKDFLKFKLSVNKEKKKTLNLLSKLKKEKKLIIGYGASTKGNTLLQYYNITSDSIPYIAERQKQKFGTYTPGSNIKIISEKQMRKLNPDYLFILPWHFSHEFLKREKTLTDKGTKFIVPLPKLKILP